MHIQLNLLLRPPLIPKVSKSNHHNYLKPLVSNYTVPLISDCNHLHNDPGNNCTIFYCSAAISFPHIETVVFSDQEFINWWKAGLWNKMYLSSILKGSFLSVQTFQPIITVVNKDNKSLQFFNFSWHFGRFEYIYLAFQGRTMHPCTISAYCFYGCNQIFACLYLYRHHMMPTPFHLQQSLLVNSAYEKI